MRKSYEYKLGRKAGSANVHRQDNPYGHHLGEWSDWDIGWLDGYTDIGWSKKPKPKTPAGTKEAAT